MKTERKSIDLNCHILNLSGKVIVKNGIPLALIEFRNLSRGTITAVKLRAKCYNSFGDHILMDNREDYIIIMQDLSIRPCDVFTSQFIRLPHNDIRKITLEEEQVCYAGNIVEEYRGSDVVTYEYQQLDELDDRAKLDVLKDYLPSAKCMPEIRDENWLCICGWLNRESEPSCLYCSSSKEDIFEKFSTRNIDGTLQEKRLEKEAKIAAQKAEMKLKKKKRRITAAICVAVSIVFITLLAFYVNASILSSRVIYESKDAMKTALTGTWVYQYKISENAKSALIIDGDRLTKTFYSDSPGTDYEIAYHPSRGYIRTEDATYIVTESDEAICLIDETGREYKAGSISDLGPDPETPSYKENMKEAEKAASSYCRNLQIKESYLRSVSIYGDGKCSGNSFSFDCSVYFTNGDIRYGTVNVYKNKDGTFKVTGLHLK